MGLKPFYSAGKAKGFKGIEGLKLGIKEYEKESIKAVSGRCYKSDIAF